MALLSLRHLDEAQNALGGANPSSSANEVSRPFYFAFYTGFVWLSNPKIFSVLSRPNMIGQAVHFGHIGFNFLVSR